MFFKRVLQTRVIGLAKICSWRGLEKSSLPVLHLSIFLTSSAMMFALKYILPCADTDETGSSSHFQAALLLFIRNDQCWENWIFLLQEQGAEELCHFSGTKGTGRGRWAALKGKTSAQLPGWAELSLHASCNGSGSSLAFQVSSIGGGVFSLFCSAKSICE